MKPIFFSKYLVIFSLIISLFLLPSTTKASNDDLELLNMIIEEVQDELPMKIEMGLTFTDAYLTASHLVFEYTCSENMIDLMRAGYKDVGAKEAYIEEQVEDENIRLIFKLAIDAQRGVRLIFLNKEHSRQFRLDFSLYELERALYQASY